MYILLKMGDFPASHVSLQGNEGIPSFNSHQDAELLALEEELKALDAEAGRKWTKGELPSKGLDTWESWWALSIYAIFGTSMLN